MMFAHEWLDHLTITYEKPFRWKFQLLCDQNMRFLELLIIASILALVRCHINNTVTKSKAFTTSLHASANTVWVLSTFYPNNKPLTVNFDGQPPNSLGQDTAVNHSDSGSDDPYNSKAFGVKRWKVGHLGLFLQVTFSFLHHEKANAFFTHFLIEAHPAKNNHPPLTDKRLES